MKSSVPSADLTEGLEILVAEDNLVNQQVALGLLNRWGCKVTLVSNGVEALASLEERTPDLILMDVQMPELDGLETTKRIRGDNRFASIPILALTAHVLPEERQMCEDVGMNDYVPKPFKPGELKERVVYWAREKRGPEPPRTAEEAVHDLSKAEGPPVFLDEFREAMKDAGIESVVGAAVDAYLLETPGRMEALDKAVMDGDMVGVEREAHGMKSASKNIRADHFAHLLQMMETAGQEGRTENVRAMYPSLKSAFEGVLDFLKG